MMIESQIFDVYAVFFYGLFIELGGSIIPVMYLKLSNLGTFLD